MRVLYSSEAATVIRCSGWPSRASQRCTPLASMVATLLEMATWVCRSGSPARESRWVNAVGDQAGGVDLGDAVGARCG